LSHHWNAWRIGNEEIAHAGEKRPSLAKMVLLMLLSQKQTQE